MSGLFSWQGLRALLREELRQLMTIHASDRAWEMPLAAALSSGLPLLAGAWFERMDYALVASLGGMVFLYLPGTALSHRMVWVMACAFGMIASYAAGLLSQFIVLGLIPTLTVTAILVTMVCRFYGVGPPGSLFFVMSAAIGAYTPLEAAQAPHVLGLFAMGTLLACLIAFLYSLYMLRRRDPLPMAAQGERDFDYIVLDSVVIGASVGISLLLAQLLGMEKPYWVPVSCLAVIQGISLRAVWSRQLQRILGTGGGLLLAGALLQLPLGPWSIALTMMSLSFIIEMTVVRHYALAAIFITPLTILLAEAPSLANGVSNELVAARFWDTALGCMVGLAGGICLHNRGFRAGAGNLLRKLIPARLANRQE